MRRIVLVITVMYSTPMFLYLGSREELWKYNAVVFASPRLSYNTIACKIKIHQYFSYQSVLSVRILSVH